MHPEKKLNLTRKLVGILSKAIEDANYGAAEQSYTASDGTNMSFLRSNGIVEFISEILKERGWKERFSPEYVETLLFDATIPLIRRGEISENAVRLLIDQLDAELSSYSKQITIYTPLVGIKMSLPKFSI